MSHVSGFPARSVPTGASHSFELTRKHRWPIDGLSPANRAAAHGTGAGCRAKQMCIDDCPSSLR
jgi:hypothetical protein